jgi:predicted MFS family arabinose efflux permease
MRLREMNTTDHQISRRIVWLLAFSTGCIVANIYYVQPLLADIARDFGLSVAQIGGVAMLAQVGTGLGMLFFVPLGDKYERRSLISTLLIGESIALACVASAPVPNVIWLSVACFCVGGAAATVHVIVPLAAHLAPPKERGRIVGTVLSGLLMGVLLARTFSGITGAQYGWRTVYWFASALMLGLALTIRVSLEKSQPEVSLKWVELMRSVWSLALEHSTLREAAVLACLLFLSFSTLWTTLVFLLRTPPYHYGTTAAGLFGLLGASSAAAAPFVGRISDRHGPERSILVAIVATLAGYVLLLFFGRLLPGLIAGIALIDVGVQSGHVANQSRIYSLAPAARSRINTFYMVAFFVGGALGSYLGPLGFNRAGWTGFCAIPLAALVFSLVYFLRAQRQRDRNRLFSAVSH